MSHRRFTDAQAERLRNLYAAGAYTISEIAEQHGVAYEVVYGMLKGETYASAGGRIHEPEPRDDWWSDEKIREVREAFARDPRPIRRLVEEFGGSESHTRLVVLGKVRREAGGPIASSLYEGQAPDDLAREIRRYARERYPYCTLAESWREAQVIWGDDCPSQQAYGMIATGETYTHLDEPTVEHDAHLPIPVALVRRMRKAAFEGRSPYEEIDDPNAWSHNTIRRALQGKANYAAITDPPPYLDRIPARPKYMLSAKEKKTIRRRHKRGERIKYIAQTMRIPYSAVISLLRREGRL